MISSWLLLSLYFHITLTFVSSNNILQTRQGLIYGRQTKNTVEYLGIQYAKVERWKPPIDLADEIFANNGSYDATSFGPCCLQPVTDVYLPSQDEQCLYLNIYKPLVSSDHSLLPVFVWIHGGAHNHGCSTQGIPLIFNGTNMITNSPSDQPVIIITINYRLSMLADLYLQELVEEDPEWPTAGNYMYLDMLSALRWIQKNIRDYGGDPTNVSIFGQSAGGLSVTDLGAVRGSSGLYRSALSESGLGSPGTITSYYNTSNALQYSNAFVQRMNCTNEDKKKVLECLRNVSFADLLKEYTNRYTRPILDNYFFPLYPPLSIQSGTYNNISLIMGNNDYEQYICYEKPDMNYDEALKQIINIVGSKWAPYVADYYHLNNCSSDRNANDSRCCNIIRLIVTDKTFDCDIRRIFNLFTDKYDNRTTFSYHMNCYPICPTVSPPGICRHSSEIPFVFGTVGDVDSQQLFNCTWDNHTREFSNDVIAQWISIATSGRPLSDWPSYDRSSPQFYQITPDEKFSGKSWNRNCSLFDRIEAENVREILNIYH